MRAAAMFAALALAVGACASDTGIVVEVTWDAAMAPPADTLRIYVGTGDPTRAVVDEASIAEPIGMVASPYRYLLRPDGALGEIGPLVIAAGLTEGAPPRPLAFDVHPDAVAFADGEIRTVRLTLTPRPYESIGPEGECAIYADDLGQPRTIGLPGDADCDGALDGADCAELDPTNDADGDGATCDVDCLDSGGAFRFSPDGVEVLIKPASVFPGQNVRDFRAMNNVPPRIECLHVDLDCSGRCRDEAKLPGGPAVVVDLDGSGADDCGAVTALADAPICPVAPSDCDPIAPGNSEGSTLESEVCDGRDTDCDGDFARPIVCVRPTVGGCEIGARACDDAVGAFAGCEVVGTVPDAASVCQLAESASGCEFADDPLGCVVDQHPGVIAERECPASVGCPQPEGATLPEMTPGTACVWTVVGGVAQGEWQVGFLDAVGGGLVATTDLCTPRLRATTARTDASSHTVLVVGATRLGRIEHVRLVEFKTDSNVCNGLLDCDLFSP